MREFWLECRRGLATPGLPMVPLALAAVAGIDAHEGVPLDILTALITAAIVAVLVVPMLVLIRRVPWIRRRMDTRMRWGGRSRDPRTGDGR